MGTYFVRFLAACYLCFNMDYNTVLLALASLPPVMPPRRLLSGKYFIRLCLAVTISRDTGFIASTDTSPYVSAGLRRGRITCNSCLGSLGHTKVVKSG